MAGFTAELAKGSPQGLRASKALVTASVLDGFDRMADELVTGAARLFRSEEAREGIAAFREKRQPAWRG